MPQYADIEQITQELPYKGKKKLLVKNHDTDDIIDAIDNHHKLYKAHYDQFSDDLWDQDAHGTAKRLFDICKQYIKYDTESPDNQSVKSPGAILHQLHGDCKHYASMINGVCDSLARKGHNIKCCYRFVADAPGTQVHHVFAVVSDGNREYWVDPVLDKFDARPKFHNIQDMSIGALYSISGTGIGQALNKYGLPVAAPIVGAKKKKNLFKSIAHGFEVNAANAGKEAAKVEHVLLNVGVAPARNAFLGLLDLNAFNLATRMSDAWINHQAAMKGEWTKLGGDPKKLLNAINNGRKHKAADHHQAPATHLSGHHGGYRHKDPVNTIIECYRIGPDDYGRLPFCVGSVNGCMIGEPISIGAMMALASAMIAVFSKYFKNDPSSDAAMAAAQAGGVANVVANAADAFDQGQDPATTLLNSGQQLLNNAQNAATQAMGPGMNISAGTDPASGAPAITVHDFNHPQLQNAGTLNTPTADDLTDNDAASDPDVQKGNVTLKEAKADKALEKLPSNVIQDVTKDFSTAVKKVWTGYKTPILFVVAGIIIYNVLSKKRKKRR